MNKFMYKKTFILTFLFCLSALNIFSQENSGQSFFQRNLNHRVYLGLYSSYFDDNIKLMQAGYDCALKLIHITPDFNLIDFGIGLNVLMGFDQVNNPEKDNFGNIRPINARITPGFELNWSIRLYIIPIPQINSGIFLEGLGMSLIIYTREYPDNGTHINVGSHFGLGMEYPINNYKAYTTLRLFHSSNGKPFENNPALNAVGIIIGLQFTHQRNMRWHYSLFINYNFLTIKAAVRRHTFIDLLGEVAHFSIIIINIYYIYIINIFCF